MKEKTMSIHWLSFTVHGKSKDAYQLYEAIFKDIFGVLLAKNGGGRGYKQVLFSLFEFKIYVEPGIQDQEHFHFEIPGKACEFIPATRFQALLDYLEIEHQEKYKFRRIDLAFDHVGFTPDQALTEMLENRIRSLAKRETIRENISHLEKREDGEIGTKTVYLGVNQSERMIRIYNKRGFTRLELQTRNNRAHQIGMDIFNSPDFEEWFSKGIAHLRDYIDFKTLWWDEFVQSIGRAKLTVSNAKEQTLLGMVDWVETQASPSLSVLADVYGDKFINDLIETGRKNRRNRYDHLLGDA